LTFYSRIAYFLKVRMRSLRLVRSFVSRQKNKINVKLDIFLQMVILPSTSKLDVAFQE